MYKFLPTTFQEFLNESESLTFRNNTKFYTGGDEEYEMEDYLTKLELINRYFPFGEVSGTYNTEEGVNLQFDNGIEIVGKFINEPWKVSMIIDSTTYTLDIHPTDGMGGFYEKGFIESLERISDEQNKVSIVIESDGYAERSITINKNDLENYKVYIVKGTQIEGKLLDGNVPKRLVSPINVI